MNQIISKNAVMLPSDLEREKIFSWLKKVSSVTAWRRIFSYYVAWTNAVEASLRVADENGWGQETSLSQTEYALILKGLAHCEEGVNRLAKGDKRIFKFDANGEFIMAQPMMSHWTKMLERIELGENGIKKNTPLWPQFCEKLIEAAQAWGECGPYILESRFLDEPAPVVFGDWLKAELATLPFPDNLADVPNPDENTFVRTNGIIPCSGIWEPIEIKNGGKSSMLSIFSSAPIPQPPFELAGAMNYLHVGSAAPEITIETADDNIDRSTTWRLIWKDERYHDGKVPKEETYYQFTRPERTKNVRSIVPSTEELRWARSGELASAGGKWLVESDMQASIAVQKGEELPLFMGREVRWVFAGIEH